MKVWRELQVFTGRWDEVCGNSRGRWCFSPSCPIAVGFFEKRWRLIVRTRYSTLAVVAACSLLLGCARHSVVVEPAPLFEVPAGYSIATDDARAPAGPWWEDFDDPVLSGLIESALQDNFELAGDLSRIERARALVSQARAIRLPQVGFDATAQRQWTRATRNGDDGSSGAVAAGPLLEWELDLWGRLRAGQSAQEEQLSALVYDYEALRLSLSALVAQVYFQIVEQNQRQALLEYQRDLAENLLELLELRFVQGDASAVDMLQQRDRVAEIESQLPQVYARLGELENRLDVLLGVPPDGQARVAQSEGLPLETVAPSTGVPLHLLTARPDLKALERAVVAQDYAVAEAIANRLPRIILDGSLLYSDASGGAGLTGSGAAGLLQPLLDWGLRKAQVEAARATFEEALFDFSGAYLTAIEEVETTLWLEIQQRDLIAALERREGILDRTVEETRVRYSLGVTDYLPVLTALQNQQEVQRQILEERLALVLLRVQLYRAIGAPTEHVEDTAPPILSVK